jgi:hypothetical protein
MFPLKARDQVSHPYTTTGKISFVYLQFFLYETGRQKILDWMIGRIPWIQSVIYFTMNVIDSLVSSQSSWILPYFQTIH